MGNLTWDVLLGRFTSDLLTSSIIFIEVLLLIASPKTLMLREPGEHVKQVKNRDFLKNKKMALTSPKTDIEKTPSASSRFSPAQALWNHREKLAAMRPRIEELYAVIGSPGELSLYQWAQFTASVLEFRPDLIIELGRGFGNSTACFLESTYQLESGQCKIVSICPDPSWQTLIAPRLEKVVPKDWFDPANILQGSILTFDFEAALDVSKRCLVFWDAHGFDVAECVLGGLLPLLQAREHLIIMHDLSDLRYSSPDPDYGAAGLWKGQNAAQPSLWLGWIFSRVAQSVSILDFTTRNNIPLYSADESIHEELVNEPEKASILQALLGPELASLQSHWFWFTLNGTEQPLTFPAFSAQAEAEKLARAAAEKLEQEAISATLRDSFMWHFLLRCQKLMTLLAPPGSLRRRGIEYFRRRLYSRPS
jgi:hypothetical protein